MGISRESLGHIRSILRKLDDSIDDARERRLAEAHERHARHETARPRSQDEPARLRDEDLDRRIG